MKITTHNRHILISLPDETETEENKGSFVLPDDYEKPKSEYVKVGVIDSTASTLQLGSFIIVPRHMIQEIKVDGETFHLVLDNYVLASVG